MKYSIKNYLVEDKPIVHLGMEDNTWSIRVPGEFSFTIQLKFDRHTKQHTLGVGEIKINGYTKIIKNVKYDPLYPPTLIDLDKVVKSARVFQKKIRKY